MKHIEITATFAKALLPSRPENGNKGTFGRAFAYVGSEKFPGAAHLVTEAMLRGGCGYTEIMGTEELIQSLLAKFPEAIYRKLPPTQNLKGGEITKICLRSAESDATLIGSGSGCSKALAEITEMLISLDTESTLIIDADAINSLAKYSDINKIFAASKRRIILTPHEMEFSRISKIPLDKISSNRVKSAEAFAKSTSTTIVLKGNKTVITNGSTTYVNTTGSSALAKGGSGDALAGLMVSIAASSKASTTDIAALACYIHGFAGDRLSEIYSEYGVTPSDLPREMAKTMRMLTCG